MHANKTTPPASQPRPQHRPHTHNEQQLEQYPTPHTEQNQEIQELQHRLTSIEAAMLQPHDSDNNSKKPFILDSGAHPTHVEHPHSTMKHTNAQLTQTANGKLCRVTHSGQISIPTTTKPVTVQAIHSPDIKLNLLGVHELTKHGDVTFNQHQATLHRTTPLHPPILTATFTNGQYRYMPPHDTLAARAFAHNRRKNKRATPEHKHTPTTKLPVRSPPPTPNNATPTLSTAANHNTPPTKLTPTHKTLADWHLRLGHLHPRTISIMAKHKLLPNIPPALQHNPPKLKCTGCIEGKTTTSPHPRTQHLYNKGQSLPSDVCGPIKPTSCTNKNYFITLIDTATRYAWIHFLNNRSQVPNTITNAIQYVANQMGHYPKLLTTDNAKEYLSKYVQNYLLVRGIQYRPTPHPLHTTRKRTGRTHQQNDNEQCTSSPSTQPTTQLILAGRTATHIRPTRVHTDTQNTQTQTTNPSTPSQIYARHRRQTHQSL